MPPKKKPPKTKTPFMIDGLTKDELSREQMEEHIVRMREELDREREERNYFQRERDQICSFREMTERKLEEATAELRNTEKEMEEDERQHQVEIKVYKQKMKHLLCEHQNTVSELKAEASASTEAVHEDQQQVEADLHQAMRNMSLDTEERDITDVIKELQLNHDEEVTRTRSCWEKKVKDAEASYDKKLELFRQELDNRKKQHVTEREAHWKRHISDLSDDHREAMAKIHHLIMEGKVTDEELEASERETEQLKAKKKARAKEKLAVRKENKRFGELLSEAKAKEAAIEKKIIKKEKLFPKTKDDSEKRVLKKLSKWKQDIEELKRKLKELQAEKDELEETFPQKLQSVQQWGRVKDQRLEETVKGLTELVEETQAQMDSVLSASHMDRTALRGLMDQGEVNLVRSQNTRKVFK